MRWEPIIDNILAGIEDLTQNNNPALFLLIPRQNSWWKLDIRI